MTKRKTKQASAWRNPLYNHPLMQRGGAHGKSTSAQRQQDKQQLKRQWRYSKTDYDSFPNNAANRFQSASEGNWITSRV